MANVSTNGIRGCAAEINSVVSITLSTTNKIQTACNEIGNAISLLESYNGTIVKGSRETDPDKTSNGLHTIAKLWKVSGYSNSYDVNLLSKFANEVSSIISTVKSQVSDIDGIASAIDSYINSVDTQLSETAITSDMLSAAYLAIGKDGVTKANLATSGEDINNRNFVNYSDIKDNGLTNTKLSFVLQDDGSYKVYSNGKETEFYTTGLAAAFYQKTLKRELENNLNTASKNNSQTKGAAALAGAPTTGNRNIGNLKKNTDVSSEVPVSQRIDNNGKITLNSGEKIYSGDIILTEDNTSYLIKNENTGKWIQYDSTGNMITNSFSPFMDSRGEISLDLDSSNLNIK